MVCRPERSRKQREHSVVGHGQVQHLGEDVEVRAEAVGAWREGKDQQPRGGAVARRELVLPDVALHDTCHRKVGRIRSSNLWQGGRGLGEEPEKGDETVMELKVSGQS